MALQGPSTVWLLKRHVIVRPLVLYSVPPHVPVWACVRYVRTYGMQGHHHEPYTSQPPMACTTRRAHAQQQLPMHSICAPHSDTQQAGDGRMCYLGVGTQSAVVQWFPPARIHYLGSPKHATQRTLQACAALSNTTTPLITKRAHAPGNAAHANLPLSWAGVISLV